MVAGLTVGSERANNNRNLAQHDDVTHP